MQFSPWFTDSEVRQFSLENWKSFGINQDGSYYANVPWDLNWEEEKGRKVNSKADLERVRMG